VRDKVSHPYKTTGKTSHDGEGVDVGLLDCNVMWTCR
jgi:hypothetical protein